MKINMPITNVEYALTETDSIVTKTDLKGIIIYANEDFIQISGFTKEELIGASHNIIRHPDMPTEVFEDLWKSIKAGRPWSGLVKNRRKNGDFYWVLANITPFYENDKLTGYISVRSKPSQQQVAEIAEAHLKFREGKAGHLKIQDGEIVKNTLLGKFPSLENISIKARLLLVINIMSLLLLVIGATGLVGMKNDSEGLRTVLNHHMLALDQINQIQKLMQTNKMQITGSLLNPIPESIQKNTDEVEQNIVDITSILDRYLDSPFTQNEKIQADKFKDDNNRFVIEGLQPAVSALRNNDITLANNILKDKVTPLYELSNEDAMKLSQLQISDTRKELESSLLRFYNTREITSVLTALSISLALWLSFSLQRSIVSPLSATIGYFGQIAQGNYNNAITFKRMHEVGKVMAALKSMQIKLGFDISEAKRIADENLQIKVALDNVSTGVIIADNDRNIIYANKSVINILGQVEADIGKQLPGFSAVNLMDTNIDDVHKAFSHQLLSSNSTTGANTANLSLDSYSMEVVVTPVITAEGRCIGSVAEWQDRTGETAVEKEVGVILVGAVMGNFTQRIPMQGKIGFYRELSEAINQLMETTEYGLNEAARVFNVLSHGDLDVKITNYYSGTLGQLKDGANSMTDDLKKIICQIKDVSESIHTTAKEIQDGNSSLSDRTEQQAASLEQTAASMQQLTSIVQENSANAKHASELAVNASNAAGKGVTVTGQVIKMMSGINESSRKIAEIVSMID
ncbi:MAG: methyl-accepting chemotaxis protein, partial [Methylobacter sp.]